jgi:cytochrome P450
MSATEQEIQQRQPAARPEPPSPAGLPSASLREALGIVLSGVLPALVRGLFAPRRSAMKLLTSIDADRRAVGLLSAVRRKHGGEGVRLLGGRLVVLWGPTAIREVLDKSADVYASDAGAKAKGMAHFQPDALTLSRGEDWRDRRAFNEAVLATRERTHPFAGRFLAVVRAEVEGLMVGSMLEWRHWEHLFDHITLRVIFGDQARSDQRLTGLLEKLMAESNRLVGLSPNDDYYEFYGGLERWLRAPAPESLLARFAQAPQSDRTRIVQQIPHWMFAMRDTLGANAYRALAAIVADSQVQDRVRAEIDSADLSDPGSVDRMTYLEGCLHEAMRLWPTTPLLARETTQETTLAGETVAEGTQVILLNVFNHRDADHVENADRLAPERWQSEQPDYRFNHLSNGSQDCPGGPLVLLLGKAVIASVLDKYSLTLAHPRLGDGDSLPYMLDFFETRFAASPRGSGR